MNKAQDSNTIVLWRYNTTTGYWVLARVCDRSTAQQWLKRFQADEPNVKFVLSGRKPNKFPKS